MRTINLVLVGAALTAPAERTFACEGNRMGIDGLRLYEAVDQPRVNNNMFSSGVLFPRFTRSFFDNNSPTNEREHCNEGIDYRLPQQRELRLV